MRRRAASLLAVLPLIGVLGGMNTVPAVSEFAIRADTIPAVNVSLRFALDRLLVPVAGLYPADLRDSFDQRRSGGRRHNAIDIMAPRGTPAIAASDGTVAFVGFNRLGGRVLYLISPDGRIALYYAHLDGYAAGVDDGVSISQGDTLGFVGSTGNARAPHLHFQVLEIRPGRHPHSGGRPLNPFALLRESRLYRESPPSVRG